MQSVEGIQKFTLLSVPNKTSYERDFLLNVFADISRNMVKTMKDTVSNVDNATY